MYESMYVLSTGTVRFPPCVILVHNRQAPAVATQHAAEAQLLAFRRLGRDYAIGQRDGIRRGRWSNDRAIVPSLRRTGGGQAHL